MDSNLNLYRLTFSSMETGINSFMYVRSEADKVAKVEAYIRMCGGRKYTHCAVHRCKVVDKRVIPIKLVDIVWNKTSLPY